VQADRIAQFLKMRNLDVESYHAGRSLVERSNVQSRFQRGTLKIIVATVAFGMGINKNDIDSIIHYCLPKSIENYIQEIGRGGRDGRKAICHLFLSRADYIKHRSLTFSSSIEMANIKEALFDIFQRKDSFVGIEAGEFGKRYDMKEQVLNTFLSYIELDYPDLLKVFTKINSKIIFYLLNGTSLTDLEEEISSRLNLLLLCKKNRGAYTFNLFEV
jgi:ATP-dependent DNA helicase Q4